VIQTTRIQIQTRGRDEMRELTGEAQRAIDVSGCQAGVVTVFVAHTTAAVGIGEFEPGLITDLPATFDRLVPADISYRHNALNHDDNAHSHLRASLLGPSVTVPFDDGRLLLGAWQQIVLIDFDTHPRTRNVVVQVLGE
jgi:secondary thiamine-phosphate synthase enzyme